MTTSVPVRVPAPRRRMRRRPAGASRRSRRCSTCRSPSWSSGRRACTARTMRRTRSSCRRCCRSRPAAVPRTAATARRRRATTPASRTRRCSTSTRCWRPRSAAKDAGATRFCMGAAWRSPKERDLEPVLEMVREVKALGLETCCTLGHAEGRPGAALREAGLDYYNHNLDTAPEFYGEIITTRDYDDRLDTLAARAPGRHLGVLRRHRRHGRDRAASAPD